MVLTLKGKFKYSKKENDIGNCVNLGGQIIEMHWDASVFDDMKMYLDLYFYPVMCA